jgi:hypothetical protein
LRFVDTDSVLSGQIRQTVAVALADGTDLPLARSAVDLGEHERRLGPRGHVARTAGGAAADAATSTASPLNEPNVPSPSIEAAMTTFSTSAGSRAG